MPIADEKQGAEPTLSIMSQRNNRLTDVSS